MRWLLVFLLIAPFIGFSQNEDVDFPRDTSFNVQSTFLKERKNFPFITIVNEMELPGVAAEREVVYYTMEKRKLHADIFYPTKSSEIKHPAVILIHGGGWASGNKSHLVPMAQKLAAAGYVAASVEYRLSPEAKYPAAITDLKTSVKWVKENADKYGVDTAKIAVLGTSAGGKLAAFLANTGGHPHFPSHPTNSQVSDKVQALVDIDGMLDFTDPSESGKDDNPGKPSAGARWFGYTYKQKPEMWVEASPINYAGQNSPPSLFVNSSLPRFHAGRDRYFMILDKFGTYHGVMTIDNTPHPFWLFHPWFDKTVPVIISFLDQVFNK